MSFDLDAAETENTAIQARIDHLYQVFTREIAAHKATIKISKTLPKFLEHISKNTKLLSEEAERLIESFLYLS